jgi:hypothetical protein
MTDENIIFLAQFLELSKMPPEYTSLLVLTNMQNVIHIEKCCEHADHYTTNEVLL